MTDERRHAMKKRNHISNHPMARTRGSALILVVLLTLILAATSIVALRDVARDTRGSSVYRTRTQAQLTSDAASRTYSDWLGKYAPMVIGGMKKGEAGTETQSGNDYVNVFGGRHDGGIDINGDDTLTFEERKRSLAVRGPILELTNEELAEPCPGSCTELLDQAGGDETGLFRTNTSDKSFETRRENKFRVITRDLIDRPPAPWYGECMIYKKGLVAAEAQVGQVDPDWNRSNNVATARHGIDAFVGPVDGCN